MNPQHLVYKTNALPLSYTSKWLQGAELNRRPSGYGPDELTAALPCVIVSGNASPEWPTVRFFRTVGDDKVGGFILRYRPGLLYNQDKLRSYLGRLPHIFPSETRSFGGISPIEKAGCYTGSLEIPYTCTFLNCKHLLRLCQ